MHNSQPSDTYKKLYYEIIDPLLAQICSNDINYCIKNEAAEMPVQIAIWHKFEEYKDKALVNMSGERLDRHKLASCICAAIIEIRPLTGSNGAKIVKRANEFLALYVGLNVIKAYMIFDFLEKEHILPEKRVQINNYLKDNFDMQFPDNICDTQKYKVNFANALYWSHQDCEFKNAECFHYDIWAYSKIFYHLELYNNEHLKSAYQKCVKGSH